MSTKFKTPGAKQRRGVILPLIAVMLIFIMGMVIFFVDVANMQLARTQLQVATDASAKAACEALDAGMTQAEVQQVAIDVAALNQVAGAPLVLEPADIILGSSVEQGDGSWQFQAGVTPFTAARVIAVKSDSRPSGSVPLFFAGAMGAGPFEPTQESEATQFEHEIMLCVDRSGSMKWDFSGTPGQFPAGDGTDPAWESSTDSTGCRPPHNTLSRWAALFTAVNSFLDIAETNGAHMQQTIGLVTWANVTTTSCVPPMDFPSARLEMPLGYSYSGMVNIMAALGTVPIEGRTNMSAGLDMAIDELTGANSNPNAKKTLILFTDGQWNEGDNPNTRIADAQADDITIHVITLLDALDPAEMDAIANGTGGTHYQASTPQELVDAFSALARSLPVVLTK